MIRCNKSYLKEMKRKFKINSMWIFNSKNWHVDEKIIHSLNGKIAIVDGYVPEDREYPLWINIVDENQTVHSFSAGEKDLIEA